MIHLQSSDKPFDPVIGVHSKVQKGDCPLFHPCRVGKEADDFQKLFTPGGLWGALSQMRSGLDCGHQVEDPECSPAGMRL